MNRTLLMLLVMGLLLLLTACDIPPEVFRDDNDVIMALLEKVAAATFTTRCDGVPC